MADSTNSVLLEVDDSSLKNKFILPENMPEDFESLLPLLEENKSREGVPWKWVQPSQGKCIKTHLPEGTKVFINICHTPDIPSPHNLDEETLLKMYASLDDESPDMGIRIPLSIGECHEEQDKSGESCRAFDVAVSSSFLERADASRVHLRFLVQVAIEAVADKFKLELDVNDYTVLKNRKAMGRLQRHRIEQRAARGPLIQELGPGSSAAPTLGAPGAEERGRERERRDPERCRLARRNGCLIAELFMADVASAEELSFRAGEDHLVVQSVRRGYCWDAFLPLRLQPEAARATFVRSCKVLNIQVPIVAA